MYIYICLNPSASICVCIRWRVCAHRQWSSYLLVIWVSPCKCVSSSFTLSEEEALPLPLLLKMGNCISREIITLGGDVGNAPVIRTHVVIRSRAVPWMALYTRRSRRPIKSPAQRPTTGRLVDAQRARRLCSEAGLYWCVPGPVSCANSELNLCADRSILERLLPEGLARLYAVRYWIFI